MRRAEGPAEACGGAGEQFADPRAPRGAPLGVRRVGRAERSAGGGGEAGDRRGLVTVERAHPPHCRLRARPQCQRPLGLQRPVGSVCSSFKFALRVREAKNRNVEKTHTHTITVSWLLFLHSGHRLINSLFLLVPTLTQIYCDYVCDVSRQIRDGAAREAEAAHANHTGRFEPNLERDLRIVRTSLRAANVFL